MHKLIILVTIYKLFWVQFKIIDTIDVSKDGYSNIEHQSRFAQRSWVCYKIISGKG